MSDHHMNADPGRYGVVGPEAVATHPGRGDVAVFRLRVRCGGDARAGSARRNSAYYVADHRGSSSRSSGSLTCCSPTSECGTGSRGCCRSSRRRRSSDPASTPASPPVTTGPTRPAPSPARSPRAASSPGRMTGRPTTRSPSPTTRCRPSTGTGAWAGGGCSTPSGSFSGWWWRTRTASGATPGASLNCSRSKRPCRGVVHDWRARLHHRGVRRGERLRQGTRREPGASSCSSPHP